MMINGIKSCTPTRQAQNFGKKKNDELRDCGKNEKKKKKKLMKDGNFIIRPMTNIESVVFYIK